MFGYVILLFVYVTLQTWDVKVTPEFRAGAPGWSQVGVGSVYSVDLHLSLLLSLERRQKFWKGRQTLLSLVMFLSNNKVLSGFYAALK